MVWLSKNVIIDRHYRGAIIDNRGKIYLISEESIRLIESVIFGESLPRDDLQWNRQIQKLKKIGILVER